MKDFIELKDQEQFESVIWRPEKPTNLLFFIYFTAKWCSACKRLNLDEILESQASNPMVYFYKCDMDENDYTGPYCGVRSMPTFVAIYKGKVLDKLSNSNTEAVKSWIRDVTVMANY